MGVSTWPVIATAISLRSLVSLNNSARNFEDAADYPGLKRSIDLLADYLRLHKAAFSGESDDLPDSGLFRFRKGAELHASFTRSVRRLHAHVRVASAKPTPRLKSWPNTRALSFCEIAGHRSDTAIHSMKSSRSTPSSSASALGDVSRLASPEAHSYPRAGP